LPHFGNMPNMNLAKWFIEGEVDWDYWQQQLQQWGPLVAGAVFGAGAPSVSEHQQTSLEPAESFG
jgi:hypothetical protein